MDASLGRRVCCCGSASSVALSSGSAGRGAARRRLHRAVHCLILALLASSCTEAQMEKGGGSKGSGATRGSSGYGTSSGSSSSSSYWYGTSSGASTYSTKTYYAYGRSYGATSTGLRVAGVTILATYVYFNGLTYPSMRFNYYGGAYYDDCAIRNITAAQQGLSDATIDLATVNSLPQLIPEAATSADILTFNQTLYNVTNGLIVDPAYCNYTVAGAAGPGLRWSAGWALALAVAVATYLGGGRRGNWL